MPDRYASLKQGLVGAWIPSISGSGLLLPDLSGRGNNGALTNMDASDWVSSGTGRALDFDGVNDRVAIGAFSAFATDSQTISAWINPASVANPDKSIVSQIDATGAIGRAFRQSNQQLRWTIASSALSYRVWATGNTLATGWQHVTVSYTGINTPTMYRNAVQQSVTLVASNGSTTTPSEQVLSIGYDGGFIQNLYNFFGGIDDVRIYNRALTEPEIRLLASEPGIGFKPAKKLSRFSQRFTYKPPKAKVFEGVRVRDHDYASLRQGLVGAWCPSLPNGGSGNLLPDQSGRGNHGTLTNMSAGAWVSSGSGRALDFDGSDDRVTLGTQSLSNSARTVSGWMRLNATGINHALLDGSTDKSFGHGLHLRITNGNVLRFWNYDANGNATGATVLSSGIWYHVCGTFDGATTNRVYLNGVFDGSNTGDSTNSVSGSFNIGASTLLNYFTNGSIDDIRIYNRALTEPEIKLLASRPGIGLQPSPTRFIAREKKTGLRRRILTGQT